MRLRIFFFFFRRGLIPSSPRPSPAGRKRHPGAASRRSRTAIAPVPAPSRPADRACSDAAMPSLPANPELEIDNQIDFLFICL